MTIRNKNIIYSTSAFVVLIASIIIFRGYMESYERFHETSAKLEMVQLAAHEIAIEMLLDLRDVDLLKEHLERIPEITGRLRVLLPDQTKPAELVQLEISFVRVRRVIDSINPVGPISKPLLDQVRNEVEKIDHNVDILKNLSEKEIAALKARAEIEITALISLLIVYIAGMALLIIKTIVVPILKFSAQVEQVRKGTLDTLTYPATADEICQLAAEFNQLLEQRRRAEHDLKNEIVRHKEALDKVKLLSGFLPICASCKQIRDDEGYWIQIESYISKHSDAEFSHGICPDCIKQLYPDYKMEDDLDE